MKLERNGNWWRITVLGTLLVLPVLPNLRELARQWELDPTYSHGWLVPSFLVYLLCQALRRTPHGNGEVRLGTFEAVAGGLLLLAAQVVPWPLVTFAGIMLLGRGLLLAIGGRPWARAGLLPLAFSFFMCPLPVAWTSAVAVWLQGLVSWCCAGLLSLHWVCLRQGNSLLLAGLDRPLVVAEGCSGLRQLFAFLGLALFVGLLLRRSGKQLLLLVALAVPCAVLANTARVLLMVVGTTWFGGEWTTGWLHDVPALLTLPLGLLLFLGLAQLLPGPACGDESGPANWRWPTVPGSPLLALLGLALLTLALQFHLATVPPRGAITGVALAAFPKQINVAAGEWTGQDNVLADELRQQLAFADTLLHRTYQQAVRPVSVQLYAAYSATGRDREHHPEICVRDVGGAHEDVAARSIISLSEMAAAARFTFIPRGQPPLTIYYWHYTLCDRDAESLTLLQRLHRAARFRPASATVQVTTRANPAALTELERDLLPKLHDEFLKLLPPGTRTGHDRLSIRLAQAP